MSRLNIRDLYENLTDEEFKDVFGNDVFKDIDVLYKGKGYTYEEYEKETERELILKSLEPLFETAERYGLLFYCSYQNLWFTPEELRKEQWKGRFIWGACNWKLRKPYERYFGENRRW